MITLTNFILIITATTTALIAGLFYTWTCSVTSGLGRLSDSMYIAAMQSINRAILNPVFFISFFGAALFLPLSAYVSFTHPVSIRFWLLLSATGVYWVGAMGVTIFGNVPLNEALDAFHIQTASMQEITRQRAQFENLWNNLNTVRTVASTMAIVFVILACLNHPDT